MRMYIALTATLVMLVAPVSAQYEMAPPLHLTEAAEDIDYAELLNQADLTEEQLTGLHGMQLMLQMETQLDPEASAVFAELRAMILAGKSQQEAMEALGPKGQLAQQVRQRYEQSLQARMGEFQALLTPEQRAKLARANSPARGLEGVVHAIGQTRQAPDEQWAEFKPHMVQMILQLSSHADPEAKVTAETIAGMLDKARALDDEQFAAQRDSLPGEWAKTVMPNMLKRLDNEQFQAEQVQQIGRRLLSYPRGHFLVQTKLETAGEG